MDWNDSMKISIIIPVLNEEKNIVKIIDMLSMLEGDFEVIFVDGGSSDNTVKIIPPPYRVVDSQKGRALQMNQGAQLATGDIFLFLHCDSAISGDALKAIEYTIAEGYIGGCYSLKFDCPDLMLSIIACLSNLRVKIFKIMFGDQGIFVRKDVFIKSGGYPEIPIMEDLELSRKIKAAGRIKQIKCKIITSSRRFKQGGIIKTMMFMHKMKLLYAMGESPEKLNLMYRDVR